MSLGNEIKFIGLKSHKIVEPNENMFQYFEELLARNKIHLEDGDFFIVTSKIISLMTGNIVTIESYKPTELAIKLAKKAKMDPHYVQLILEESDYQVFGYVEKVILTRTRYGLCANAGIDKSNAEEGKALLLPKNLDEIAVNIHEYFKKTRNIHVNVVITDSRTRPLRIGTGGVALTVAGFNPLIDDRGKPDLYGKPLRVTRRGFADNLASAAEILMGESSELIPVVIGKNIEHERADIKNASQQVIISDYECLYFSAIRFFADDLSKELDA